MGIRAASKYLEAALHNADSSVAALEAAAAHLNPRKRAALGAIADQIRADCTGVRTILKRLQSRIARNRVRRRGGRREPDTVAETVAELFAEAQEKAGGAPTLPTAIEPDNPSWDNAVRRIEDNGD